MAGARLFEMLDSIAIQLSPHSYRPVIESMFYDGVVNDGRLYTLRCFTSVMMMIKYPWVKDYIRFEYKKFTKRLTSDSRRRHPRGAASTDLPAYHRCYSPPPPPPPDGVVRFVSPPASPTPTTDGFRFGYSPAWPPASPLSPDYQPNSLPDYRPDSSPPASKKQREHYCHCNQTLYWNVPCWGHQLWDINCRMCVCVSQCVRRHIAILRQEWFNGLSWNCVGMLGVTMPRMYQISVTNQLNFLH